MSEEQHVECTAPGTEYEASTTLSSYFTSNPETEDIFDSVFGQNVDESVPTSPTQLDAPCFRPEPVKDNAVLLLLRQRDAWLPSEATRRLLSGPKNSKAIGLTEIKPYLSKVAFELSTGSQNDPYHDTLFRYMKDEAAVSAIRSIPVSVDQAPLSIERLKELITDGWYRPALDLTRRLLTNWGYGEDQGGAVLTPLSAQIWLTRFALLMRVRNFELAQSELTSFQTLDAPNIYFEHAPELYPGRFGSIIPFSLRLLHAELPFHLGRVEESLDRLYYLLAIIGRIQCNLQKGYTEDGSVLQPEPGYAEASLRLWHCREVRVHSSCLSIYLSELDYQAAIETVHRLAVMCSADQAVLRGLASVLGRIYLQLGDLETSKVYFGRSSPLMDLKRQLPVSAQQLFQKALLAIGRSEYDEAKKLFQQVLSIDPTNVAAANNMVVCSLYLGQLSGAIHVLDNLATSGLSEKQQPDVPGQPIAKGMAVVTDKTASEKIHRRFCLHESLVCNLAVLYEAESDGSTTRKVKLLERLASLPGEPVNIANFKLPNT